MLVFLFSFVVLLGSFAQSRAIEIPADCDRVLVEISRETRVRKPTFAHVMTSGEVTIVRDGIREARFVGRDDGSTGLRVIGEHLAGFLLTATEDEERKIGSEEGTVAVRVTIQESAAKRIYSLDLVNDAATRNMNQTIAEDQGPRVLIQTDSAVQALEQLNYRVALLMAADDAPVSARKIAIKLSTRSGLPRPQPGM